MALTQAIGAPPAAGTGVLPAVDALPDLVVRALEVGVVVIERGLEVGGLGLGYVDLVLDAFGPELGLMIGDLGLGSADLVVAIDVLPERLAILCGTAVLLGVAVLVLLLGVIALALLFGVVA